MSSRQSLSRNHFGTNQLVCERPIRQVQVEVGAALLPVWRPRQDASRGGTCIEQSWLGICGSTSHPTSSRCHEEDLHHLKHSHSKGSQSRFQQATVRSMAVTEQEVCGSNYPTGVSAQCTLASRTPRLPEFLLKRFYRHTFYRSAKVDGVVESCEAPVLRSVTVPTSLRVILSHMPMMPTYALASGRCAPGTVHATVCPSIYGT